MLINSSGETINTQEYTYFNRGNNAIIKVKDDEILKLYKDECLCRNTISKSMFKLLKEIDNKSFVKLKDFYSYGNKITFFSFVDAYTMDIVKNDHINLLNKKLDYIEGFSEGLESLAKEFAKERIVMYDTNGYNIIFNNNGAVIIDPDKFYFDKYNTYYRVLNKNRVALLEYIRSYIHTFYNKGRNISDDLLINNMKISKVINEYFYFSKLDYNKELPYLVDSIFQNEDPCKIKIKN